jgi:DNA repair ATPase RecN
MVIEGFVNLSENNKHVINDFLKKSEIEIFDEEQIIIRRELYTKGYSRNFINDTPAGTNELKQLGDIIVDIHSQNEHQSLLKKDIHIELLDSFVSKASPPTPLQKRGSKTGIHSLLNRRLQKAVQRINKHSKRIR